MRLLLSTLFTITLLTFTQPANALEFAVDDVLVDCVPTPIVDGGHYPGVNKVSRTNNLRRKTGIALVAKGQPIYIWGKVVDEDCIPIDNAEIEIWHTNTYGKYQAGPKTGENYDENFSGAGYAKTDNLGRFNFLTIFPGETEEAAPRVHFRIRHKDFESMETVMYFPEDEANAKDATLEKLKMQKDALMASYKLEVRDGKYKIDSPDQDVVFHFNITLPGKHKYKHF